MKSREKFKILSTNFSENVRSWLTAWGRSCKYQNILRNGKWNILFADAMFNVMLSGPTFECLVFTETAKCRTEHPPGCLLLHFTPLCHQLFLYWSVLSDYYRLHLLFSSFFFLSALFIRFIRSSPLFWPILIIVGISDLILSHPLGTFLFDLISIFRSLHI